MTLPVFLGLLTLVVGVPLNLVVTVLLWRRSVNAPDIKVLRERLVASCAVLLVVTVFGLIFVNNDQAIPPLDTDTTRLITRAAMLVVGLVPATYWLALYWRAR